MDSVFLPHDAYATYRHSAVYAGVWCLSVTRSQGDVSLSAAAETHFHCGSFVPLRGKRTNAVWQQRRWFRLSFYN